MLPTLTDDFARVSLYTQARNAMRCWRVRRAAEVLRSRFGATQVILFGSLAHEAWYTPDSDIDIAVQGIGDNFWQAWKSVEEIIGDRNVDLIAWDMASESLRKTIHEEGIYL
ncbi:MAG: nucleotidyltransferase domain-containing protein [Caldilineaceae bacterium]